MVLLKKFLIALAIFLYTVAPVFAGGSDRVRGHWQGQGAKMLNIKAGQQTAWAHLKKAHLKCMRAPMRDFRLATKRFRIAVQSSAGGEGLISRHKREYQIAVGRSFAPYQRLFVGVPSHRFRRSQSKDSGKSWGQGYGKSLSKRHGMGQSKHSRMLWNKGSGKSWGRSCDQGWEQGHRKNSNKCHGMGGDKGAGERGDRSRGDKSQKNRNKKSFDSD